MNERIPAARPAAKMPWDWFLMALLCLALCILQFRNAGMKRREMDDVARDQQALLALIRHRKLRLLGVFVLGEIDHRHLGARRAPGGR